MNAARGLAKPCGFRLPKCSTKSFHKRCLALLPEGLKPALRPLVDQIEQINTQIEGFNKQIEQMTEETFPETQALVQVSESAHSRPSPSCLRSETNIGFRRVETSAAISDCGLVATSPAAVIRSWESPKPVTDTCELCWSNVRTTS